MPQKNGSAPGWPKLDPACLVGLAGDVVRTLDKHTESAPAAILVQFLLCFGNVVGRGPYYLVEADQHHMNLFATLAGRTAKARKGTSFGYVREIFEQTDPGWKERIQGGLSSGEGLIWAVRDPIRKYNSKKEEEEIVDPGVADKRLLVVEAELASTIKVLGRDGNILSPIIRAAWDRGDLQTLTKNSPARATNTHVSIIGHITFAELRRYLDRTEMANGFANRFLWICVERSKLLPDGGNVDPAELSSLVSRVQSAIRFARCAERLHRSPEAKALWHSVYCKLSAGRPGLLGSAISRAEAQTIRLASVYALLDSSSVIEEVHLRAALALWKYAEDSAEYIFGNSLGDPLADVILAALRGTPDGLTRTEISRLKSRHMSLDKIEAALRVLLENDLAEVVKEGTGGRPVERWIAKEANKGETAQPAQASEECTAPNGGRPA